MLFIYFFIGLFSMFCSFVRKTWTSYTIFSTDFFFTVCLFLLLCLCLSLSWSSLILWLLNHNTSKIYVTLAVEWNCQTKAVKVHLSCVLCHFLLYCFIVCVTNLIEADETDFVLLLQIRKTWKFHLKCSGIMYYTCALCIYTFNTPTQQTLKHLQLKHLIRK